MKVQHIANMLFFPTVTCAGFILAAVTFSAIRKQGFSNPKLELSAWKWIVLLVVGMAVCFELVFYRP
ncbi:MAG: hypothetical protein ABI147_07315 [Acidobacteriaceae bacterium]